MSENETTGTFVVMHAGEESAVLQGVDSGRVYALADNPGFERHDVVGATLSPVPPGGVAWTVESVGERFAVSVERDEEPPNADVRAAVADAEPGTLEVLDRERGECHAIAIGDEDPEQAAADVAEDEATVVRAAALGATRVVVRAGDGALGVSYRQ